MNTYLSKFNSNITVRMKNTVFRFDMHNFEVSSKSYQVVTGAGTYKNKMKAICSSLGEYLEREAMFNRKFHECIQGMHLRNSLPIILTPEFIDSKYLLCDSCGLATHQLSCQCVENAFNEFVERQSFIFSYLSKTKGRKLPQEQIEGEYKDFKFYNISLLDEYYVILGYGLRKNKFYIGLGASLNFEDAMKKCIKELNQFNEYYRDEIKDTIFEANKQDDYMDIFLRISPDKLYQSYLYLGEEEVEIKKESRKKFNVQQLSSQIYEQCNIDPIICFIKGTRHRTQKLCQIIDLNWFPSLSPYIFREDIYKFIEESMGVELDRRCTFIPFP